ncbi:DUF4910 domain-containing protein, partial [Planctomycetota bacterium]
LSYIKKLLPGLTICDVPSGTSAFDWVVPNEWNIKDAFVAEADGKRVIDFHEHNLSVVGYSEPVDEVMSFAKLDRHLHSLPNQPLAIPYVTSYYKPYWGFCLTEEQRQILRSDPQKEYHVKIDATLKPGNLCYGELIIPGREKSEVLLSTYICHPSMANNELSGPAVLASLAQWISEKSNRRYTYRLLFTPETIGTIVYLSRHLKEMKARTVAGFVVSCVGDDLDYSYIASRFGNTLSDKVMLHVLRHTVDGFTSYSFLDRGSDERQYCSPGIDLPVCTFCRSKFGAYPEYHTSLDGLGFISPQGLSGALGVLSECVNLLEANAKYRINVLCEPQLGKRGLYPTLSTKESGTQVYDMMNFIAYADGNHDLVDIAEKCNLYAGSLIPVAARLEEAELLESAVAVH